MTEEVGPQFIPKDLRIIPTEHTIRQTLEGMSTSAEAWNYVGFPLLLMASRSESDLLNYEKQVPRFFSKALGRIFNDNPLKLSESGILVVVHFQEDSPRQPGLITAVKTHDLNMGSININGISVPAFLDWRHHGQPCEDLSMKTKQEGYPSIKNEQLWGIIEQNIDRIPYPSQEIRKKRLRELRLINF